MERHVQIQRIRIPVEWQAIVLADVGGRRLASRWPHARLAALGLMLVATGACLLPGF